MSKVKEQLSDTPFPRDARRRSLFGSSLNICALFVLVSVCLSLILNLLNIRIQINIIHDPKAQIRQGKNTRQQATCSAPLPTLLAANPPRADTPVLRTAAASLHEFLSLRTAANDIDSLSIAVVTPDGPIFERGYGVLRANESDPVKRGSITRDSIYRIASITKMFVVLEALILRERGALNWDDPVTKFLPNFTYPAYGWSEFLSRGGTDFVSAPTPPPITLRQLASHLSGIGRDYPPSDIPWPAPLPQEIKAADELLGPMQGSWEDLFKAVAKLPLITPQYTFPVYSNTGFDILGYCVAAADALATGESSDYRATLQRDVFAPLGMNSSFYAIPNKRLAAHMAVPASDSEWADLTFDPVYDPAGGQYSSLADLTALMQGFLAPQGPGVISSHAMREWLRPLHPWSDGFQEVGAPWEIRKVAGEARLYSKGGNVPGYHSQFILNPQWSYGVIVLVTGAYEDAMTLAQEAIARFQPAFEHLLGMQALYAYGGVWVGDDSVAVVTVEDGGLVLQTLIVGDQDVLSLLQMNPAGESKPVALWATGHQHEFRLAIGRPGLNENPDAGCEPYWVTIDFAASRGAPLDLIYWDGGELVYPSAGVRLRRD
ncbi:beta-lactamase/transpeptidase-like protein [Mycena belliarum]|uniref:Beta-lactamase/transpeptidase-like protein n=1 Tax=Mycena belliarum TaxID=1033014 RepID=A0AAD6UNC2_9AGAR|nr:beta-lactamase/transpeptidase-like protein [Mycena belliae]